ncbi:MAG: substrate-binding domain-containing protein [Chloroflexi bacterium]|nr:substrate-binding domain-containing protein [Chloroflexota bacterium]
MKMKNPHNAQSLQHNARPTVGLLVQNIATEGGYESTLWNGIVEVCQQRDANLISFVGGSLYVSPSQESEGQRNAIYDLAAPDTVDGLIIIGSLGSLVSPEELASFYERYRPLPIVSIALTQHGIPSILVDNYGGMRNVIAHLTQAHGHRRIAFIRGPESDSHAVQRYRAYTDVLTEYGLQLDPDLVTPGDFTSASGTEAIRLLLDERQVDFKAVVAANDHMAIGAIAELQRRGIHVPRDVAVAGFDDIEESGTIIPSLTTAQQPLAELGKRAAETLFTILSGEPVPSQVAVSTKLVARQSCGCLSQTAIKAAAGQVTKASESFETILSTHRENILFRMVQTRGTQASSIVTAWAEQLLDAFAAELKQGSPGAFLSALDDVLRQSAMQDGDVASWNSVLSALRLYILPYLSDSNALLRAEDLWQQGRVMIGEMAQRVQMFQKLQIEKRNQKLHEIGQVLLTTFDMGELTNAVVRNIPQLGVSRCYISLYEGRGVPAEKSKLVIAYDEHGRVEVENSKQIFSSRQLVPDGFLSREEPHRRYSIVVEPLYLKKEPLGFALFEVGPRQPHVYEALRGHLSTALQSALLVQEVDERTKALQTANYAIQRRAIHLEASAEVGRAITSIFNIDELLRRAVHLIRDQFGFYHAGIFLLDEAGEWAVLQEATGEAGAQMKAQGHRLAVGETSMVGWTALHREPRIALYAGEDEVRFANPLLPYTRSEMTLPMMIGGRPLGVLNVQSTEEAAFDDDDVRALQSMSNQVAVAIENAQQVSHEARLLEATSPIYRISRQLAQVTTVSDVADSIIASVAGTGADGCIVVEFEFAPAGDPKALLYRGVWRGDRDVKFQPGMRIPFSESQFPFEMISSLWTVPDVEKAEHLPESARQVFLDTGVKALANIPLRAREKVIGQVTVLRITTGPFSESALRLYEALSDQAAVALERAQLWEQAQRRAEREQLTRQITDRIRRAADMDSLMQTAVREMSAALGVSNAFVQLSVPSEIAGSGNGNKDEHTK